jgi:tRNA A-37 threonylcarbamoyl transferase component Bud32
VTATPQPQLPFQRLGQYEVLAPIAEGGMASVWLARSLERPRGLVALKVIRAEYARNKEFVAMFLDEARIASRLAHPNIVRLEGLGLDGKRHFLTMEVLRGCSLLAAWEAARAKRLRMAHEVVAWIGARIADALHYAHEMTDESGAAQQVVHRDVNPANVFLGRDGTPKLIDFGLAKARDRVASTAVGIVKGKLAYLSPEQTRGKPADRRADVFALSVTLWELTLDRRLFLDDNDVATVRRVFEAQVPDPSTIAERYPRALADAIVRGLARDPADRWQTAAELRDALDAFVRGSEKPVDAGSVRAIVAQLTGDRPLATWERIADEEKEGATADRLRVWDDDRQKLTWMPAFVAEAATFAVPARPSSGRDERPSPGAAPAPQTRPQILEHALAERAARLGGASDRPALARAHLERALVDEFLGDGARAAELARLSLDAHPTAFAHALLRRHAPVHGAERAVAAHLDAEIALLATGLPRADLLAERARVIERAAESASSVRAAWESALAANPSLPAALNGLEAALAADPEARPALAAHLGQMADAYVADARVAAHLCVERARVLAAELGQPDGAKAALQRALALDGRAPAVRAACLRHAIVQRDAAWTVALLEEDASLTPDSAGAARRELDAACIARHRLGDVGLAVALLERVAARTPAERTVHRRALDELVLLHEAAGRVREAVRVRRLRLPHLDDPRAGAHELRTIAALQESLDDPAAAIAALERALQLAPADESLAEALDRLFEAASLHDRRATLWAGVAAASEAGARRARLLVRAARFAEVHGDGPGALEYVRAAQVADPTDAESTDVLLRMLAPRLAEGRAEEVRARIAVHAHAAEHATDADRRIAHLECVALLQEERLGDSTAAATTYEVILRLEPARRGAAWGLARNAARVGDSTKVARALLAEAEASTAEAAADLLRVRAAEALAATEPERALSLAGAVLARNPAQDGAGAAGEAAAGARWLEQRIHEKASRWGQVDAALAARIEHAADPGAAVALWLARADLQRTRLRSPGDARASLRAVLAIDPAHPAARTEWIAQLEAAGDPAALRAALVELAPSEASPEARAASLARAAEIEELLLSRDDEAAALYARALAEVPGDTWLEERRARVLLRMPHAPSGAPASGDAEAARAEKPLASDPADVHALRAQELSARSSGAPARLAEVLGRQADAYVADAPRLGALWALAGLLRRSLPDEDDSATLDRILQLAPADRAAIDAVLQAALPKARAGDAQALARVAQAMRALVAQAAGDSERLMASLGAALAHEPQEPGNDAATREALAHYTEALRIDPGSVVAAFGAERLATAVGDSEAMIAASIARGEIATDPTERAAHWVGAAGRIVSARDPRLGGRPQRLARAGQLLEQALDAYPEALPAVALLAAVRTEEGARDRLLGALRSAFERATSPHAVVRLGAELARVASSDPPDRVLAIETLRRVLTVEPGHGPTLRALADLLVAQQAWGDAVQALETLATQSRDPAARLAAQLQLADIHTRVLARPADAERALRAALDVDPESIEALRKLLDHVRTTGADASELAVLLAQLAEAETDPEAKAAALTELAPLRRAAGDAAGAEAALVEALAQACTPARLALALKAHAGQPAEQARVLAAAVARAGVLQRPDASVLAALGGLEVDDLGRAPDGVGHLRVAVALAPAMHEARTALARGLLAMGVAGESVALLLPMVLPDASSLLALANPAGALATLEAALSADGRREEAVLARDLRALSGGLDEDALGELRTRRLPVETALPPGPVLDATTLRSSVVPAYVPSLLLDVAAALSGAEAKIAQIPPVAANERAGAGARAADAGRTAARDRIPPSSGHPLLATVYRLAAMFGVPRPEVALGEGEILPRLIANESPWLAVPAALLAQPAPVQAAALVPPLVRLALGVPWMPEARGSHLYALFCAAARLVVPSYASDLGDEWLAVIDETGRRLARAIGRKQKKALAELAPALGATRAATPQDVQALELGMRCAELRAACVATGDLLATLEAARALDEDLARATAQFGPGALRAVLTHPIASDLVRFALAPPTTALRWHARTLWGSAR